MIKASADRKIDLNRYLNYLILAYAFFLPISRAAVVFLSMLLILLWLLEGNFRQKFHLVAQCKVLWALGLFIVYNLISLAWSDNVPEALNYVKKYWYFTPMIMLYTSIKKEYIPKALSFFIAGMFVSEVLAYGVFFELWHFRNVSPQNPTPFMHHIEYSVFLAFTSLLLLTRIFNTDDWKTKLVYSLFFTTITGNLFLTAGRTGQLAFLVGLFVVAMTNVKNKFKALLVFVLLTGLLFGLAYKYSETFHKRIELAEQNLLHLEDRGGYCTSWGSRVGAWVVSRDMIVKYPIFGIGIDDNMQEFYRLIQTKYPKMICSGNTLVHMHDQYLQILTQTGMVGLILFLLIFVAIAQIRLKEREYRNIKYIYLAVTLFAFIPEVLLHRQFGMALFALIVGLLMAQYRVEHEV